MKRSIRPGMLACWHAEEGCQGKRYQLSLVGIVDASMRLRLAIDKTSAAKSSIGHLASTTPPRQFAESNTMLPNRRSLAIALVICGLIPASSLTAQDTRPGGSIFDGKTLDGWEGDSAYWRVEDGAIVGEIPAGQRLNKNTWLVWRAGKLTDFDLHLQFRLSGQPGANSGIQFRSQVRDIEHVSGYQADLDMGATWLGRIYDEHGRALLVERGSRVFIAADGKRGVKQFAPAEEYAVLFRPGEWNEYRIVASGDQVAVTINGTLFCELRDQQEDAQDLSGELAFQLHSGPPTKIEFRDIRLTDLTGQPNPLKSFKLPTETSTESPTSVGVLPTDDSGKELNLGFETGTLADWTATGDAFAGQPVERDGINSRWPKQTSGKVGRFFIGGFERVRDAGTGSLTSRPFPVTQPYASFLIGGGQPASTRVEIITPATDSEPAKVLFQASGANREQMQRVMVDLQTHQGQTIAVRLIDQSQGGWGHLNFDDFRFHAERPQFAEAVSSNARSTHTPLLQHLVVNPRRDDISTENAEFTQKAEPTHSRRAGTETTSQMYVPAGFSVDVIAAEPDLHQPMAFTFDAKGRLWVVEGHSYPQKRPAGQGLDKILIFSDQDGDGHFEKRQVFCEGLNLVSGLEVGFGGVWVGAAPELLFIPDRNGDDIPDSAPQKLLDGFGFADTHETLNSLMWGPDGWLYGNQGVFNVSHVGKPGCDPSERLTLQAGVWRYHPERHQFEVFAHGGSNQWGLDYDQHGQIFMTHCRSRWGGGSTTHVMQGGHYWNQVNSGYADFISAAALPGMPHLANYLLASSRYGHGEGGAGRVGSRQVYGGHSHVGTMIYLGDNWPAKHYNRLFTHNLHGHQMNQQENRRELGGYHTVHAGEDMLFCGDPQYIGIDLKVGPDGAVYFSDWYDPRHCHNPNVEHWDRGNGRIYRMQYDANFTPVKVDYQQADDETLAIAQSHGNAWHARTARRVLSERSAMRPIADTAIEHLTQLSKQGNPTERLRAIWGLHACQAFTQQLFKQCLDDPSEYVRGWGVQLAVESLAESELAGPLTQLITEENSLLVKRYLASAITRLPEELSWLIIERLSSQLENAEDRNLVLLLWYGMAELMPVNIERCLTLAEQTPIEVLHDYILWYAAKLSDVGRAAVVAKLTRAEKKEGLRLMELFSFSLRSLRGLKPPVGWDTVAADFYDADDPRLCGAAETLGAAFGDQLLFARKRETLITEGAAEQELRQALKLLAADRSPENLPALLSLLNRGILLEQVIPLTARYNSAEVAMLLIDQLPRWEEESLQSAAMNVLTSRPAWATQLMEAIERGSVSEEVVTAYYVRQMANLNDVELNSLLSQKWGRLGQSSADMEHQIKKMSATYQQAPLWAYDAGEGRRHFQRLCAACHPLAGNGGNIAPKLDGSGSKGIDYLVENILDPNAVIGRDFQSRVIVTLDGRVITGLVETDSDSALVIRTQNDTVTVAKEEIESVAVSDQSFMPTGLFDSLNERERIELLKYLMSK
ncbi:PVC-type heme-binding CxxCH protein [Planctomycetaceae bacterium SH139]